MLPHSHNASTAELSRLPEDRNRKTLEEHLIGEIQKTGFPLEIEVSDLMQENWVVLNNTPYLDSDKNENRTIDIYGIHESDTEAISTRSNRHISLTSTDVVIECKKSNEYAWIFYTRPNYITPSFFPGGGQRTDFLEVFSKGERNFLDLLARRGIVKELNLHYDDFDGVCYGIYDEIKLQKDFKSKSRDDIFEAISQLTKFADYSMQRDRSFIAPDSRDISILFAAIIFDGRLYEAVVEQGNVKLRESPQLFLSISSHSKTTGRVHNYYVDVVHKSTAAEYFKSLENDIKSLRGFFSSNQTTLTSIANEEVTNIMGGNSPSSD